MEYKYINKAENAYVIKNNGITYGKYYPHSNTFVFKHREIDPDSIIAISNIVSDLQNKHHPDKRSLLYDEDDW